MSSTFLPLRKLRDFGERVGDTVQFLKLNWDRLLLLYAVFVLPFLLMGVILGANSFASMFSIMRIGSLEQNSGSIWKMAGAVLIFILAAMAYISVVYLYMDRYEKNKGTKPSIQEVASGFMGALWSNIGYTLLIVLMMAPVIGLFAGLAFMWKNQAAFFLLMFPVVFVFLSFLMVYSVMVYPVNTIGKARFPGALKTAWQLLRGKWWFSLGYVVILGIIYYFFAMTISLAVNLIFGITAFTSTDPEKMMNGYGGIYPYVFGLSTVIQQVFYLVIYVGIGIHYYSLLEARQGSGLEEQLEQLGNHPSGEKQSEEY